MTWAYGVNVLDLEPRGPLPTEIYWRRRGLALGIAVVVIGVAVAAVIAFVGSHAGAKPANADKPAGAQDHPGSSAPQAPQPAGQTEGNAPGAPPQGRIRRHPPPPPRYNRRRCSRRATTAGFHVGRQGSHERAPVLHR
ncbi:putative cONSERVED MEMBRANE PROTEIN [Mycobacterium ulcerans str. Harvey]|uniref:CONSERVED MEMBRANE PROTEIN n=1 Tax=Mycobacterium ulcerans str. Harvey TaxID=1299332 RepID=A0ABN0R9U4_MYCUL|nr:putative cONSERVED MEMBRANE PROTEIN [Mycobacterium ulcerans str. Harvey]